MDPYANPYTPGAGTRPPALTGRDAEIEQFEILLGRLGHGRAEKSMMVHGLRGVGKTVLLNKLEDAARRRGWPAVMQEIRSDTDFRATMARMVYRLIRQLIRKSKVRRQIDRLKRVQTSFSLTADTHGAVSASFGVEAAKGTADSGDIEEDLVELFAELGQTASRCNTGVVFLLDELQLLAGRDLEALIAAVHRASQKSWPIAVIGAGLPTLPSQLVEAKSYAERLFSYRHLGKLDREAAAEAIVLPASEANVDYQQRALACILDLSEGYPYFLQEWGKGVWDAAAESPITAADVEAARPFVQEELDEQFFAVRLERATPAERRYLAAVADLGDGPQATGEVATQLGYTSTAGASVLRQDLIAKGLIYSPRYGQVDFTVPHFASFMRRRQPPEQHT